MLALRAIGWEYVNLVVAHSALSAQNQHYRVAMFQYLAGDIDMCVKAVMES